MNSKKEKNLFIKADLYLITDILIMLTMFIFVLGIMEKEKKYAISFGISGIATLLVSLIQLKWGQAVVKNNSDEVIYAKLEEASDPVAVPPHSQCHNIDGFKAHGKVYKIPDGVHAKVSQNGKVRITSRIGTMITMIKNGGSLQAPPDGGWQKLFDR